MSANFQTPDSKKEEFRKYLEKSGVIEALTKVLVGLYEEPERPDNAIEYIKKYMGAPANVDVDAIRRENDEMKAKVKELTKTVEELNLSLGEARGEVPSAGTAALAASSSASSTGAVAGTSKKAKSPSPSS